MARKSDRRNQSQRKRRKQKRERQRDEDPRYNAGQGELARIQPKTPGQNEYQRTLRECDVVFGLGPAGTGKTFLAVYEAAKALENGHVSKVILTRPAVEAGEKLGFLPGKLTDKVAPYLQPLMESLNKLLTKGRVDCHIRNGKIEIAPLAFMRGRTLEDAYVILDEAQNCTFDQLMMLLTRLGEGSRCVLTGDASQVDLEDGGSGLLMMLRALEQVEGVGIYELTADDVQRHRLVADIIRAVGEYRTRRRAYNRR